ncbi:CAP domain-containing protein [Cellulomonas sp. URHB0016]
MTRGRPVGAPAGAARTGWALVVAGMLLAGVCVALLVRQAGGDGPATIQMPPATRAATPAPTSPPAGAAPSGAPETAEPPPAAAADPGAADPDARWSADVDPAGYARALVVGTNDARAAAGLPALSWSDCAADQAVDRARALVGRELAHADLEPVIDGCASSKAAENLSRGAGTARAVVGLWLDSPGHRANLLAPDLDRVGVGCARDGDTLVCSQVFLGHA